MEGGFSILLYLFPSFYFLVFLKTDKYGIFIVYKSNIIVFYTIIIQIRRKLDEYTMRIDFFIPFNEVNLSLLSSHNMKKKKTSRSQKIVLSLFFCTSIFAKSPQHSYRATYIEKFKGIAIQEMKRSGIPASVTLAQGILESGWGKSPLAKVTNNHFGIKCHADWEGERYATKNESAGEHTKGTCYRAYDNSKQSYQDHTDFILHQSLYKSLFQYNDYHDWAEGLEHCGYAGNKNYAEQLVSIIDRNELFQFDIELKSDISKEALALYEPNELLNLVKNSLETQEVTIQSVAVVKAELLSEEDFFWLTNELQIIAPAFEQRRRTKKTEGLEGIWV